MLSPAATTTATTATVVATAYPTNASSMNCMNMTNKQSLSSSSSFVKLALLAILALVFLNSNISSSSSSQRLRTQTTNPKKQKKRLMKQKKQGGEYKVVEQYEDFEEYDASTYSSKDAQGSDSAAMEEAHFVTESISADESEDGTDVGAAKDMKEGSYYDEKWLQKNFGQGEKKGKIAWLMSFPNSGTSFTSLLIRHASNATTATNYGMESHVGLDEKSVPVYDWSEEGPYWLHPPHTNTNDATKTNDEKEKVEDYKSGTKLGKSGTYDIPPNSASIMTKTHCGSRCAFCPPQRYLETSASFLKQCLSGSRKVPVKPNKDGTGNSKAQKQKNQSTTKTTTTQYQKQYSTYHPSVVEKAVHLIRNPFDNLVSRFHHEQKEHKKKDSTEWTNRYSNDVVGFKKWCADEDALYAKAEQTTDWEAYGYPANITRYFEGVSCHGEFFRYVQWHVMALRSVEILDIPVLYVYYEDYSTNLRGSTDEMLEFLSLDRVGELPHFESNKDYSGYFTREERASASDFMQRVASDAGMELLERYLVDWDFEKMKAQTKSIQ